jgi:hypothetical protein
LFSNDERMIVNAQRPVILNGIEEFVRRGDLSDRTVFLNLPPIAPSKRRREDEFWAAFNQDQPRILGGLLDAIVGGMRELPSVQLPTLPRMADFAAFGEAVGRALGWKAETVVADYNRNRREATAPQLEDSLVATAMLENAPRGSDEHTCTASSLLAELSRLVGKKVASSARWPKSAGWFTTELRRIAPQLRMHGISITFERSSGKRLLTITTTRR